MCLITGLLKIGDVIALYNPRFDSYLSADGIILEDLTINHDPSSFDDNLFCVCLQRQYSAARELNAFMENYEAQGMNLEDESTIKYLDALKVQSSLQSRLAAVLCPCSTLER
jgi:hypothetical protein